jgi:hypothetical protein
MTALLVAIAVALGVGVGFLIASMFATGRAEDAYRAGRSDALDEQQRRALWEVDSYGGTD